MKLTELFIVLYALCAALIMGFGLSEDFWIRLGPVFGIISIVVTCVVILPKWIRKLHNVNYLTDLLCFMLPLIGIMAFLLWRGVVDDHTAIYVVYGIAFAYLIVKIVFKRWFAKKYGVRTDLKNEGEDNNVPGD